MEDVIMSLRRPEGRPIVGSQGVGLRAIAGVVCLVFALSVSQARAQFSARDGYAENGGYRVQVEITPYLWLPAVSATASFGRLPLNDISVNRPPPSVAQIVDSLHGAFVGYGLLRYGPWSAELDLQWIDAFHKRSLPATAIGPAVTLKEGASVLRIAPGLGYQIYSGGIAGVPTTVDARAGFSVFTWDASAHFEGSPFSGISVSHSFVQPWAGFRADFYPWRDWRFELGAMAEGFGVNGGVWGWGASALVSYSITSWLDVTGGFRALNSKGRGNGSGPFKRSIDFTGYGPVLGFGIRF
jgi:hypothetical protein